MMVYASQSSALLLLTIAIAATSLALTAGSHCNLMHKKAIEFQSRKCDHFETCCDVMRHADEYKAANKTTQINSNTYFLFSNGPFAPTYTYCDLDREGEAWTVIMRKKRNDTIFNRNWEDYVHGFGSLNGSFWYGLKQIQSLTSQGEWMLRIDVELIDGRKTNLTYDRFQLLENDYKMVLSNSHTGESDNLSEFNGNPFSTFDHGNTGCATTEKGGWWYTPVSCIGSRGTILTAPSDVSSSQWRMNGVNGFLHVKSYEMKISSYKRC